MANTALATPASPCSPANCSRVRLAEAGIGVDEVRPGIIATDMTLPYDKYDRFIAEGGVPAVQGRATSARRSPHWRAGRCPITLLWTIAIDGGLGLCL
ncbi:MAG: hypothetical protein U1F68_17070 [Gammaproteobacteria bacterium]